MLVTEAAIRDVAEKLKKPIEEIIEINFYRINELTHFNQPTKDFFIERVWHELISCSDFKRRSDAVRKFNVENKFKKRGIACMPTKFGISFPYVFLNQAGALVHIYTDGSVRIAHGGAEMGQGVHTKMIQIAAQSLGVPLSKIHLSETNTNVTINASVSVGSMTSDLNGMAVLNACEQLNQRLKPYKTGQGHFKWEDVIKRAYFDRVNLSANGFYKTPGVGYDWKTNRGMLYNYFTYGAACSEVEIDTLTGDHKVIRSDIVMDIGKSINPSIDIGQIEGAFSQGQGWTTIEEPLISPQTGALITKGPGNYKIPGFKDVPTDLRIRIIKGSRNVRAIHSSKAVGEPPFFLGASVFFAIKDAIGEARLENGIVERNFRLDCPATSERIRLGCGDELTKVVIECMDGEKPWYIAA